MPCGQLCAVLGSLSSMMLHPSYGFTEAAQENKISMFFLSTESASLGVCYFSFFVYCLTVSSRTESGKGWE